MRSLIVVVAALFLGAPSLACELRSPADLVGCYEDAFNDADVKSLSALLAEEYTESFLSEPRTAPAGKAQTIEAAVKMWSSANITSYVLDLSGDLAVVEDGDGLFRIEGIRGRLTIESNKMDVGNPGTFVVDNWITWHVRKATDGFEITTAEYWTSDPGPAEE